MVLGVSISPVAIRQPPVARGQGFSGEVFLKAAATHPRRQHAQRGIQSADGNDLSSVLKIRGADAASDLESEGS